MGVGGVQSSGACGVKHVFTDHPQQLDFQISFAQYAMINSLWGMQQPLKHWCVGGGWGGEGGGEKGSTSKNSIERVQGLYFISFYGINVPLRILPRGSGIGRKLRLSDYSSANTHGLAQCVWANWVHPSRDPLCLRSRFMWVIRLY